MGIKHAVSRVPFVGRIVRYIYWTWVKPFRGSENYWKERYATGGNSGDGSYNQLAEFKAEVLNEFVLNNAISSLIEYGCGDGNQLGLAHYPNYIGFDVSPNAIERCISRFSGDGKKAFRLMSAYDGETAELTLSLDVIFHLVEDSVFTDYMDRLFDSSEKFVVIYSSNTDHNPADTAPHVKHRRFSKWISDHKTEWSLVKHIPNKYPFNGDTKRGSFSDFYIYSK